MTEAQQRAWIAVMRVCFRPGAFWDHYLEGYNGPPPNVGPRRWDLVRRVAMLVLADGDRVPWRPRSPGGGR